MVLKRIEIFGFKSFPDKTVVEFPSGITGIVGPNGSGKSNISDAIRWVLGEQSAKSLRGEKMEDVIFAGTAKRPPLGFAEVNLTFENTRRIFPLEFSEVSIGRRLYRSGESSYLLNKQECRLRDIQDLLMDSGIGKRTHAIIEQGKVEEIITAKPEQRRLLIEEAAGIAKYRARRAEAMRKLQSTREGLQRVEDLIEELERRRKNLERQARKAQKFAEYKRELREREIRYSARKIERLRGKAREIQEVRSESERRLAELEAAYATLAADLEKKRTLQEEGRRRLREVSRRLSEAEKAASACEARFREIESRRGADERTLERLEGEISALERERRILAEDIEGIQKRITDSEAMREVLVVAAGSAKEERERIEEEEAAAVKEQGKILESRDSVRDARGRLLADREALGRRREEARATIAKLTEEIEGKRDEKVRLSLIMEEVRTQCRRAEAAWKEAWNTQNDLREKLQILEKRVESLRKKISGVEREEAVLQERIENLQERRLRNRERIGQALRRAGLSEEDIETVEGAGFIPGDLEKAFAAAVPGIFESLCLSAEQERVFPAGAMLSAESGGRWVFPAFSPSDSAFAEAGVELPTLADFLEGNPPESLKQFLRKAFLACDEEEARRRARELKPGCCVVTPSGVVIHHGGGIKAVEETGAGETVGALERLTAECRRLREFGESLKEELRREEEEKERFQDEEETVRGRLEALREEWERKEKERERLEAAIANLGLRELEDRKKDWEERLAENEVEAERLEGKIRSAGEAVETSEKRCAEISSLVRDLRNQVTIAREIERELRSERDHLEEEIVTAKEEFEKTIRRGRAIEESLKRNRATLEEMRSRVEEALRAEEGLRKELAERTAVVAQRREEFSRCESESLSLEAEVRSEEEKLREIAGLRESSREEIHGTEVEDVRIEGEIRMIVERIREYYGLDLLESGFQGETAGEEEDEARIGELREILDRMGAINHAAAEELEETLVRAEFYQKQKDDLVNAEISLSDVIREIDTRTVRLFRETFEAVNMNFGLLFNRLFSGRQGQEGTAELILLDPANPLESGVDIIARPPGKKPQSISLLSGGEKAMTAIALLFSVFLVRPSPFAVLDELDAPLDEANVERYTQILKEFSQRSQFIVMTHNKRTMEAAETLYGVSMPEKGVSRILGVQLTDVDTVAEAAG